MKILLLFLLIAGINGYAQSDGKVKNVAIFIYDNVELLDFSGPGEVLANAKFNGVHAFNVYTVAATDAPIVSLGFVTVTPQYTIKNCPAPDIIVLPGGDARKSRENEEVIQWIKDCAESSEVVMSVCTGAGLLSKAGLLDGKEATTWYGAIDRLQESTPKAKIHRNTRFVDNGQIVTTAGVSAGIDGALHIVKRLLGEEEALRVVKYMEYDKWIPDEGLIVSERN
ncbi:MAG: DJ-1/PfpI family protein [Ignavibacteriales bacterium]|nr:MAG: DJ-1/PfpI family protein [Ignavibacteriales bacterium]